MTPIYKAAGLAWDDNPHYMEVLAENLGRLGIQMEVVRKSDEFQSRFDSGSWSFVVLDLFDESVEPPRMRGSELARNVASARASDPFFPIFVLTGEAALLTPQLFDSLPSNVNVHYKISDPYPMALLIRDELRLRGAYTNPRKTFLVAPMINNRLSPEGLEIQTWLNVHGQDTKPLDEMAISGEIIRTLLEEMSECRAIVVLCTADDTWHNQTRHPRQNVILELGIALGAGGGLRRLIIIKQQTAEIPSDLGGVVTLNFRNSPSEIFKQLEDRLSRLGVDLTPHP
jgi:CheY-like chemotaxis protein